MDNLHVPEYFNGFDHPGHHVKLFSKANNHFQILLRDGNSVAFEPNVKEADRFKDWMLNHDAMDVKNRKGG